MTPSILVVAGLDPSGGAGLLADVEVAHARGLHAAAVATDLTVQDTTGCRISHPVAAATVAEQLALLVADLDFRVVKIGSLGNAQVAAAVVDALAPLFARGVPVVIDPVLRASVGASLFDGDPAAGLLALIARATLVTPNRDEAELLSGLAVTDIEGQAAAARALRSLGAHAVLVKGGHVGVKGGRVGAGAALGQHAPGQHASGCAGDSGSVHELVHDLLDDGASAPLILSSPRHSGPAPHGTGCALSTEIACALALGAPLRDAVTASHARVAARIAAAISVGRGRLLLGKPGELEPQ